MIASGPPLAEATAFRCWTAAYRLVERGASTTLFADAALKLMDRIEAGGPGVHNPPADPTGE